MVEALGSIRDGDFLYGHAEQNEDRKPDFLFTPLNYKKYAPWSDSHMFVQRSLSVSMFNAHALRDGRGHVHTK